MYTPSITAVCPDDPKGLRTFFLRLRPNLSRNHANMRKPGLGKIRACICPGTYDVRYPTKKPTNEMLAPGTFNSESAFWRLFPYFSFFTFTPCRRLSGKFLSLVSSI